MSEKQQSSLGFSILTFVIAFGVVALLSAAVFMVVNPAKRLGQSYDARRWTDIIAIAKAVETYVIDNHQIPSDFSAATNLAVDEKFVLCSSSGSKTCDGQTESCLVVNDTDFLGKYLPSLPVDPTKSATTDTGYYVTRKGDNMLVIGSCSSYDTAEIKFVAKAALPDLVAVCGDGDVEGSEACDDGDVYNEGCGNGFIETAGDYCNYNCTATTTIAVTEGCDYIGWTNDCETMLEGVYATENDTGAGWCLSGCSLYKSFCTPV